MPYEEIKPEERAKLVAKRGEAEVARFELTQKAMAAFEDYRPKGRRFQAFVRHTPMEWADDLSRPPQEIFIDDPLADFDHRLLRHGKRVMRPRRRKVPAGGGSYIHVELWEDVNYKLGVDTQRGHVENWRGVRLEVKRTATAVEIAKLIEAAFKDSKNWSLKG